MRNRQKIILNCNTTLRRWATQKIIAPIRDINFARECIEMDEVSSPTSWRSFKKPGAECIKLTVMIGRRIKKALDESKGIEQECEITFPDGARFGFRGTVSKVKAGPKRLFAARAVRVVIGQISNKTYRGADV